MSSEVAVKVAGLGKAYPIFGRPEDRLKQMLMRGRRTYYHEFWALQDVDLEIYRGETVGIIGCNGSGKSTLLQLICGTLAPTLGEVRVNGRVAALLELGAGFNPEFTGRENVYVSATIQGYEEGEIDSRFDDIAAFADIGEFIDQPVKIYSSGMYARLAFAVAINVDPDILIVDEALAVGDEAFQRKCYARIEEIKREGGTILFVSHSSNTIVDLCDRAVLLHTGKRLFAGEPKRAVSWYQKLMNTPHERSAEICTEIRQADAAASTEEEPVSGTQRAQPENPLAARAVASDEHTVARSAVNPADEADYDVSLVSKSVVSYPTNGAMIRNPRVLAHDARIVNCLVSGERYRLCYDVRFERDCKDVRFYTLLKTVTGVELGGGVYPQTGREGIETRAGETVGISFEFTCMLNPGTYFLNCGVGGNGGQSLHRIIDALPFRVLPKKKVFSFGVVDFGYKPTLDMQTA